MKPTKKDMAKVILKTTLHIEKSIANISLWNRCINRLMKSSKKEIESLYNLAVKISQE